MTISAKLPDVRRTRFPELGYRCDGPGLWRIYDISDHDRAAAVGPQYRTRGELLADLDRYATEFGVNAGERLNVYGCTFHGYWPVGASAVIVAINELAARNFMLAKLLDMKLDITQEFTLMLIPLEPGVTVLDDGNY